MLISGQPDRHHDLEALGTGKIGDKPDFFERCDNRFVLINGWFAPFLCLGFREAFESLKDPDGMFAVISTGGAEFIQDGGLLTPGRVFIS